MAANALICAASGSSNAALQYSGICNAYVGVNFTLQRSEIDASPCSKQGPRLPVDRDRSSNSLRLIPQPLGQRSEATKRWENGEPILDIACSYNVRNSTISRLTA